MCDCLESGIAQVNMVDTSATWVGSTFASVAWVVHGAGIGDLHHNAGVLTSAVSTVVGVQADDLEMSSTVGGWAMWAFRLALVC